MNMRLLGAPTMADVVPAMVDTSALYSPNLGPTMYHENCTSFSPCNRCIADSRRRENDACGSQGEVVSRCQGIYHFSHPMYPPSSIDTRMREQPLSICTAVTTNTALGDRLDIHAVGLLHCFYCSLLRLAGLDLLPGLPTSLALHRLNGSLYVSVCIIGASRRQSRGDTSCGRDMAQTSQGDSDIPERSNTSATMLKHLTKESRTHLDSTREVVARLALLDITSTYSASAPLAPDGVEARVTYRTSARRPSSEGPCQRSRRCRSCRQGGRGSRA